MATSTSWQLAHETAQRYGQYIVPTIIGPFARVLALEADLRPGEKVLDVGCGTGAVSHEAVTHVGAAGLVVASDLNAGMVNVGRLLPVPKGTSIEYMQASAQDLPFASQSFDVVLCSQTLQFVGQPELALAEMKRVAKPNGRIVISVWDALSDNPFFNAVVAAVDQVINPEVANAVRAAFRLSTVQQLRQLTETIGFESLDINIITQQLNLSPLHEFIPRYISATPMASAFASTSGAIQAALVEQVVSRLEASSMIRFQTFVIRCMVR